MAYLTPERFKTMRHGLTLTGLSDLDLSEILEDASAIADAYCTVPWGYSFLGGSVVGEQRPWHYPDTVMGPVSRKVFPKNTPVIAVSQFLLVVGSEASASLPVDSLVINNQKGWIEVTSASIVGSSGLFGVSGWVVPFGGLEQPIAQLDYTYGRALANDTRLYAVGDDVRLYQAPHGFWHNEGDYLPTITVNGVELTVTTDYTVDAEEGRILLEADPDGPVRASYWHKLPTEIPRAVSYIAADLIGASKLVAKGMTGVNRIKAGEIEIERQRRGDDAKSMAQWLAREVPRAATLLDGFQMWSAA